jgi:ferredoxin-thioredoxin reductase catalytic subunit
MTPERTKFQIGRDTPKEEVIEMITLFAEREGYRVTPDERTLSIVVKGLLKNVEKYGVPLCPCRPKEISGDLLQDEKLICPCVYLNNEIQMQGACRCRLFVNLEYYRETANFLKEINRL